MVSFWTSKVDDPHKTHSSSHLTTSHPIPQPDSSSPSLPPQREERPQHKPSKDQPGDGSSRQTEKKRTHPLPHADSFYSNDDLGAGGTRAQVAAAEAAADAAEAEVALALGQREGDAGEYVEQGRDGAAVEVARCVAVLRLHRQPKGRDRRWGQGRGEGGYEGGEGEVVGLGSAS